MNQTMNQNRRDLLRMAGVSALGMAVAPALVGCGTTTDYDMAADKDRLPDTRTGQALTELVRLATLAPSGHNTQPWKFAITPDEIRIYPDLTRRLAAVDPNERELWISLGTALENLLVAAEHAGYQTETTYMLNGTAEDHISISLKKNGVKPVNQSTLFKAIPLRQCTRNEYDRTLVSAPDLKKLETALTGEAVRPILFTGRAAMELMLDYVNAGNNQQMANDAFKTELTKWIRFSDTEAIDKMDGLASRTLNSPNIPRWIAELFIGSFLNSTSQNKTDDLGIRSSSGLLLLVSQKNDRTAWIETGRTYERFALLSTAMNIKNAFINQPCEVPALRVQVQSHLNLNGAFPQLLLRFGHSVLPCLARYVVRLRRY